MNMIPKLQLIAVLVLSVSSSACVIVSPEKMTDDAKTPVKLTKTAATTPIRTYEEALEAPEQAEVPVEAEVEKAKSLSQPSEKGEGYGTWAFVQDVIKIAVGGCFASGKC